MANKPDPKFIYRTLLTLYAKQEGFKITFYDSPEEKEKHRKREKYDESMQKN